ncbi:MAG: hypothetical protein ACYC2T_14485 [Bacillota bacterium]
MKALALYSGGLDSTVAIKVVQDAGIEVEALNFTSPFCRCQGNKGCSATVKQAETLGVPLHIKSCGQDYLKLVENPKFGYGRNINPCIDCRIYKFSLAKEFAKEIGASFMFTGEVLGQRPNSQRMDAMAIIDREADIKGYVLRPLSAIHLEPTLAEKEGWIDRTKLLDIKGRSRKQQMELAEHYGINDYPCPSGGCLLTSAEFAQKIRDLLRYKGHLSMHDVQMLKIGRHFRLSPTSKAIVGRNQAENEQLQTLLGEGDILAEVMDYKGPLTIGTGTPDTTDRECLARITARYSDAPAGGETRVRITAGNDREQEISVQPFTDAELDRFRIVQDQV